MSSQVLFFKNKHTLNETSTSSSFSWNTYILDTSLPSTDLLNRCDFLLAILEIYSHCLRRYIENASQRIIAATSMEFPRCFKKTIILLGKKKLMTSSYFMIGKNKRNVGCDLHYKMRLHSTAFELPTSWHLLPDLWPKSFTADCTH